MARRSPSQNVPTEGVAQVVSNLMQTFANQRRAFERRWYDNNFFDDGFHFRYVSRTTGKIVDLTNRQDLNLPERAIPKASRQLRGVANLLVNANHKPVIYPEKVSIAQFGGDEAAYLKAKQIAKQIAQKTGHWIEEEWNCQDLKQKLTQMVLLTGKHGISFLEVWPDDVQEKIRSQVYDAFDIYLHGTLNSIYDSPAIIKAVPEFIDVMRANETFDEFQREKLNPDNKYAASQIKEAYMKARFGSGYTSDKNASSLLQETFTKEYLTEDNWDDVINLGEANGVMEGKSKGDMVMRHTFSTSSVWLKDEYIDLDEYPFVDFRMEPGQIYQVPMIERFIPANKSLDIVMSRVERYANTMVTGVYQKRKGENYQITNMPGGQMIEYETVPLTQMNMANVPPFMFEYIQMLNRIIEEQGAATSALNQLPTGVKSGVAIESVKQTEYANLKIASDQMRDTVKRITERLLFVADKFFFDPQEVAIMEKGEPTYFDVAGASAMKKRKAAGIPLPPETIPIKSDSYVTIEVESDMGYTMEGKRQTMTQLANFVKDLAAQGYVTQEAVSVIVNNLLETFQFGATQEFTESMKNGMSATPMSDKQLQQMKVAVIEVLKEAGVVGAEADEKLIQTTKIGALEALKDAGQLEPKSTPKESAKEPSQSISFKDLPPEGKAQLAAKAGIMLNPEEIEDDMEEKNEPPEKEMEKEGEVEDATS